MVRSYFSLSPQQQLKALQDIRDIFFASSSRKKFSSAAAKDKFFHLWTDYYLKNQRQHVWLWIGSRQQVGGYLMGTLDSREAGAYYSEILPSYFVFADLFNLYPAHLHINCSPELRGQGIGSQLIRHFTDWCRVSGCVGVHLITSPTERNVGFYLRNGFEYESTRDFRKFKLHFMGRGL